MIDLKQMIFYIKSRSGSYNATGEFDGKGIKVLANSKINNVVTFSPDPFIYYRHNIDKNGFLTKDMYFKTPSAAAKFVTGRSANGWVEWKTASGDLLDNYRLKKTNKKTESNLSNSLVSSSSDNKVGLVQSFPKTNTNQFNRKSETVPESPLGENRGYGQNKQDQPPQTESNFTESSESIRRVNENRTIYSSAESKIRQNNVPLSEQGDRLGDFIKKRTEKGDSSELHRREASEVDEKERSEDKTNLSFSGRSLPDNKEIKNLQQQIDSLKRIIETLMVPQYESDRKTSKNENDELAVSPSPALSLNKFRIAKTHINHPDLKCLSKGKMITSNTFSVKFRVERSEICDNKPHIYHFYFINKNDETVSEKMAIDISAHDVFSIPFLLSFEVEQDNIIFLAVRSGDDSDDELLQLVPFQARILIANEFAF